MQVDLSMNRQINLIHAGMRVTHKIESIYGFMVKPSTVKRVSVAKKIKFLFY